jgi:hypothetical protein
MPSNINDLTISYEEEGVQLIKELDKKILSNGSWATVMFKYQQWDNTKKEYSPDRYTIRRYRKRDGEYYQQSKFNISSNDQATKIIEALQEWMKPS